MFGAILKATNSSFQKGMTFCRSVYGIKVMKLLAFIFEQPSYYLYRILLSVSQIYLFVNDTRTPAFSKSKINDWRPLDLIIKS